MKSILQHLQHHTKKTLFIALVPFLTFILCSVIESSLRILDDQQITLLSNLKQWSLFPYETFWNFTITMLLLHLIHQKIDNEKSPYKVKSFLQFLCCVFIISCTSQHFNLFQKNIFLSKFHDSSSPLIISDSPNPQYQSLLLPKVSTFAENLLSLDMSVFSMALSTKNNLLYINSKESNLIQAFNVSDPIHPTFLWSANESLGIFSGDFILSKDENILFIYDGLDLGVYQNFTSSNYSFHNWMMNIDSPVDSYKLIDISPDGKTLFLGGMTFQIYDVTDPKTPKKLYVSEEYDNEDIPTSILLSKDGKTLFMITTNGFPAAQGSLKIIDVTNLRNPVEISTLELNEAPTSLGLFHKKNQLLIATYNVNYGEFKHELSVHQVDVSDLESPKVIYKKYIGECRDKQTSYIFYEITKCMHSRLQVYNEDYNQAIYFYDSNLKVVEIESQSSSDPIVILPNEIDSPRSVVLLPGSDLAFIGGSRFHVARLSLEVIPNPQVPLQINVLSNSILDEINPNMTVISSNHQIAFIVGTNPQSKQQIFAIYNISNEKATKFLSSLPLSDEQSMTLTLSKDEKSVYVGISNTFVVFDVSNLLSPQQTRLISFNDSVLACTLSPDGNIAYLMLGNASKQDGQRYLKLAILNLTNTEYFIFNFTTVINIVCSSFDESIALSSDGKTLYFIHGHLFTLQLPTWQELLQKTPLQPIKTLSFWEGGCSTLKLNPNNQQILFILSAEKFPPSQNLKVLNVSSRNILSSVPLAYKDRSFFCSGSLQIYNQMLAVVLSNSLIFFDISKLSSLSVFGYFQGNFGTEEWNSLRFFSDSSSIFYSSSNKNVTFLTMDQLYTLSTHSKSLQLGKVYSEELQVLVRNNHMTYNPLNAPYKFITLSLCNFKISPNFDYPELHFSLLPSWIHFDRDNGIITAEPKSDKDIKSYKICSALSHKILPTDFNNGLLSTKNISIADLLSDLISLGYIDTDYFLTPSFDPSHVLSLKTPYSSIESSIRETLTTKFILTGMQLSVEPSVCLNLEREYIQIETPSQNALHVTIQLDSDISAIKFVSKTYPNVLESINHDKNQINFDGSLLYINNALEQILINFENDLDSCKGFISVTDRLNPIITKEIPDITKFFKKNLPPLLNTSFSLQNQISNIKVYTAQYMIIPIDHRAFKPQHEEELTYQLIMQDGSQLPAWISLRDLSLVVTPPEKLLPYDIELGIVAKNEFKGTIDKFTLTVYPSLYSLVKMLAAYCGTLISLIGLRLYYPRIYNVLFKKHYRHPVSFILGPGDNVAATGPYPISFIEDEIQESRKLFKLFKDFIAKDLQQIESISTSDLVQHFIDPATCQFDKTKIIETLDSLSPKDSKKNQDTVAAEAKKKMIYQLIINQMIISQIDLPNEATSKKLFIQLKKDAFDFVDLQLERQFIINDQKLQQRLDDLNISLVHKDTSQAPFIDSSVNESLETGLLTNIDKDSTFNFQLLKDALWVHVFDVSNINANVSSVSIECKRKVESQYLFVGFIKRFLKKDLRPVLSADGKRLGFGLKRKIQNGVLTFYGIIEEEIRGNTLVIQIANRRGKILKEIWIYGDTNVMNQDISQNDDIL